MTRYSIALILGALATIAAAPASRTFVSADRTVRLTYPAGLPPTRDFTGRPLMNSGWRMMWDGSPTGRGEPVARFQSVARPVDNVGRVTESVQIGMSRAPAVVATCGTAGLHGTAHRMPNRMLGGHRWTVWDGGDAGMSQEVTATNLRSVVNGACFAVDRVGYTVKAVPPLPHTAPSQAAASARMDAILDSIRLGR